MGFLTFPPTFVGQRVILVMIWKMMETSFSNVRVSIFSLEIIDRYLKSLENNTFYASTPNDHVY
jgi:hypothetical protein